MSGISYKNKIAEFKKTYALCPKDHLHRLLIDIPRDIPVLCNVVWPVESLDNEIVNQDQVFVSQLRTIRVKDCPCLSSLEMSKNILTNKFTPMIKVKVHDIVFFGFIVIDSDGDYINEDLYNLIKTRQHPFVFRETDQNLPKYKDAVGRAIKLGRLIVLPFDVQTNEKTIVLHHEIPVVKNNSICPCIFGAPFLKKIGVHNPATLIINNKIQIETKRNEFIPLWKHKYYGYKDWVVSIHYA